MIVIQPAQPEVIYAPQYNPTVVYGMSLSRLPAVLHPAAAWLRFSNAIGGAIATGIWWGVGVGISNAIWVHSTGTITMSTSTSTV